MRYCRIYPCLLVRQVDQFDRLGFPLVNLAWPLASLSGKSQSLTPLGMNLRPVYPPDESEWTAIAGGVKLWLLPDKPARGLFVRCGNDFSLSN